MLHAALKQENVLTGLDGDGVAKPGAVQLPGQAQRSLRQRQLVLLHVLALGHDNALAIQGHCSNTCMRQALTGSDCVHGMLQSRGTRALERFKGAQMQQVGGLK